MELEKEKLLKKRQIDNGRKASMLKQLPGKDRGAQLIIQHANLKSEKIGKQEKPAVSYRLSFKIWHRPTLPRVTAVPSALVGLTSLFGMGRGRHHRYRHLNIFNFFY